MEPIQWLVVGLGSTLVGDDAFGPSVVAALRGAGAIDAGTELADAGTDLLALVERFAGFDQVLLIDAMIDPGRAGQVVVVEETDFGTWTARSPSAHQLSPLLSIQLFRKLYPEASTSFSLIALCVAALEQLRSHGLGEAVRRGSEMVRARIAQKRARQCTEHEMQGS